ncbi:viral G protein-coupled receptor [Marmot herpesvirus 1]|nr:viral G protein-coupled receptor [Marmot herpesvirus 1]
MATPSWIDVMMEYYNYSDYGINFTLEEYETVCKANQVIPEWILVIIYMILCLLNVIGNGIVIGILFRYFKIMQSMDILMVSLCLASLVFMIGLGIDVLALSWVVEIQTIFCKIQFFMVAASSLWIAYITATIAILRTLLIMLPTRTWIKHRSVGICLLIIVLIFGLICGTIASMYADAVVSPTEIACYLVEQRMLLLSINSVIVFLIPLFIILVCYSLSCFRLCKRKFRTSRAYSAFFLAITLFILLCAPRHCVRLIDTVMRLGGFTETCLLRQILDTLFVVADCMHMLYCALVSLVYAITGSLFRIRLGQCISGVWRRSSASE